MVPNVKDTPFGVKVLVATDDRKLRSQLKQMLDSWGYKVITASEPDEVRRLLATMSRPRIALIDWAMLRGGSVSFIETVREMVAREAVYVILVTDAKHKDEVLDGLRAGADDYIVTPFKPHELHVRVEVGRRVVRLQAELSDRIRALEDAKRQVKSLQGLIPICCYCHKVRDDSEVWNRLERYIEEHTEAQLSHGMCPDCLEKHFPGASREGSGEDDLG